MREDALPVDDGPEPMLEPLTFLVQALEENEDPTVGLPIATHRTGGAGRGRRRSGPSGRPASCSSTRRSRQRLFNGQVRDL